MTSTWIKRAPASSTAATCSPSRAKSAARIEGAMWRPPRISCLVIAARRSDRREHAPLAVHAGELRSRRHAHDRGMLAAVRADRHELEAMQAVDAAVAPGHVRRAQPGLVAGR